MWWLWFETRSLTSLASLRLPICRLSLRPWCIASSWKMFPSWTSFVTVFFANCVLVIRTSVTSSPMFLDWFLCLYHLSYVSYFSGAFPFNYDDCAILSCFRCLHQLSSFEILILFCNRCDKMWCCPVPAGFVRSKVDRNTLTNAVVRVDDVKCYHFPSGDRNIPDNIDISSPSLAAGKEKIQQLTQNCFALCAVYIYTIRLHSSLQKTANGAPWLL